MAVLKKRTFVVGMTLLLIVSMVNTVYLGAAQTPESSSVDAEQVILRVIEGNDYEVLQTVAGEPVEDELYQIRSGESQTGELPPVLNQFYGDLGVRDIYIFYTSLTSDRGNSAVTIEMRVTTLPDAESAESFVIDSFDLVVELAREFPETTQNPVLIEELPEHDGAITGWTATESYSNFNTGEGGLEVSAIRFMAQEGSTVASVRIYGTDQSVGMPLADTLFAAQISCLRADASCEPIPFPALDSATPVASVLKPGIRHFGR
ncbi:hypothetical protein BH20CHL3_BH20CHL3_08920 [soil metagenome]